MSWYVSIETAMTIKDINSFVEGVTISDDPEHDTMCQIVVEKDGVTHELLEVTRDGNFITGIVMRSRYCDGYDLLVELTRKWDIDFYEEDEDDGQPTEYEEWQDYMGGDDWDHGQYDD